MMASSWHSQESKGSRISQHCLKSAVQTSGRRPSSIAHLHPCIFLLCWKHYRGCCKYTGCQEQCLLVTISPHKHLNGAHGHPAERAICLQLCPGQVELGFTWYCTQQMGHLHTSSLAKVLALCGGLGRA